MTDNRYFFLVWTLGMDSSFLEVFKAKAGQSLEHPGLVEGVPA